MWSREKSMFATSNHTAGGKQCGREVRRADGALRGPAGPACSTPTGRPRGSRPGQQLLVLHFVNKGEKRAHSYKSGDTPVTSSSLKWYVHKSSKGKSQVHWLPV